MTTMCPRMHCLGRLADLMAVAFAGLLLSVPTIALAAYVFSWLR